MHNHCEAVFARSRRDFRRYLPFPLPSPVRCVGLVLAVWCAGVGVLHLSVGFWDAAGWELAVAWVCWRAA